MKKSVMLLVLILLSGCVSTSGNTITGSVVQEEPSGLVVECHDSDEGFNPGVRGVVTYKQGADEQSVVDLCEGLFLTEYYCEKGYLKHTQVICENSCSLGACIK
ncbi:hypothetical protein HYV79_00715 [Candidatus Woesearchaeota archaeon]|nr:hypothetical protein [Candidatus Woesearchaeota archaeon]